MKRLLFLLSMLMSVASLRAVQAYPGIIDYVQPNGDTLQIRMVGDERFHYVTTADGYLVQKNNKGYYCYAVWESNGDSDNVSDGNSGSGNVSSRVSGRTTAKKHAVAKRRIAKNPDRRSRYEQRWLIRKQIPHRAI